MTEPRRVALVQISEDYLAARSVLPAGTRILSARMDDALGMLLLQVEHESLPPVEEGEHFKIRSPRFRTETLSVTTSVKFDGWSGT